MKIKLDFVTNSSSCCFLISSPEKITKTMLYDKGCTRSKFNSFDCISTKEKLIEYVDYEPMDWIKKATGPHKFWGASKEQYHKAMNILKDGNFAVFIDLERNYPEHIEKFETIIRDMDCEILEREYD